MAAKLRIRSVAPHKRTTAIATSAPTRALRVRLWFRPVPGRPLASLSADASSIRETCRSEEHTSELQSRLHLVCRLLLEKKKIHVGGGCCEFQELSLPPPRIDARSDGCRSRVSRRAEWSGRTVMESPSPVALHFHTDARY